MCYFQTCHRYVWYNFLIHQRCCLNKYPTTWSRVFDPYLLKSKLFGFKWFMSHSMVHYVSLNGRAAVFEPNKSYQTLCCQNQDLIRSLYISYITYIDSVDWLRKLPFLETYQTRLCKMFDTHGAPAVWHNGLKHNTNGPFNCVGKSDHCNMCQKINFECLHSLAFPWEQFHRHCPSHCVV